MKEILPKITIGKQGYAFVFDQQGTVLYHPSIEQGQSIMDDDMYSRFMEEQQLEYDKDGEKHFINRFHNDLMNWNIGSIFKESELDETYASIVKLTIGINVICGIVLVILIYFLVGRITKPLENMSKMAQQVANGDLKERMNVNSQDEVGQLSLSFNEMTDGLASMIHSVNETVDSLNSFSAELSMSVEENTQSIQQITTNVQDVSERTKEQLDASQNVQHAVDSIGTEINQIAQNVSEVKSVSNVAEQRTETGVEVMLHALNQMETIRESSRETETNFRELMKVANEIDKFSKIIRDIAEQTNLLALNASIEAARAGEHGKGFAVVADEVRKLAESTSDSVNEIQSLVSSIQKTEHVANNSLLASEQAVEIGKEQIESAHKVFNDIYAQMRLLGENVSYTEKALAILIERKEMTVESVQIIMEIAEMMNANVEQVAASTEEQQASMEQMAVSAEQLAQQAQDLQKIVSRFEI